jgi:lipoprotein-anchoring transpeptidase ErfK/SrfK
MTHTRKNPSVAPLQQQHTVPGKRVQPQPEVTPPRQPARPTPPQTRPAAKRINWWVVIGGGLFIGLVFAAIALVGGLAVLYTTDAMLPGTRTLGVDIGGLSRTEAATQITTTSDTGIIITDGQHSVQVTSDSLGIVVDADATAEAAYDTGREQFFRALLGTINVPPVLELDLSQTERRLQEIAPQFEIAPVNAGVRIENGSVVARSAQVGYTLNIEATLAALQQNAALILADGELELVMMPIQPDILDASGMVAQAAQLLSNPLQITAFDPVRNEPITWTVPPTTWSTWLIPSENPGSGVLALTLATEPTAAYLQQQSNTLGTSRYLNVEEATAVLQNAVANGDTVATLRIFHTETQHTVAAGETFWSLAYDYGIPYGWLTVANPGPGDSLSVGQTVTIPSPDELLPLPIVYDKRIVINISQQRMWAYENGQVKWEWIVSTGIADSPTAPGVFQVQTHFENAYAGNWDLWMPHFIGIYQPVPNIDFMNGFHGFPTRSGSQLLWTNSLGTRVTYGCILLSNENAQLLYNWAEQGVVVEIQP